MWYGMTQCVYRICSQTTLRTGSEDLAGPMNAQAVFCKTCWTDVELTRSYLRDVPVAATSWLLAMQLSNGLRTIRLHSLSERQS